MKKNIIKVEGMVCGGCEKRVENALTALEGINKVKANHKKGTVEIYTENQLDEKIIKDKIEDIGFSVKE